jgi:sigma-B regulation protein RsbU (phosphoserine phosphatase)
MTPSTDKLQDIRQAAIGKYLSKAAIGVEGGWRTPGMDAPSTDTSEQMQFLTDEIAGVRRDHAKLQQAVFEAAQVQRKLCAPRELNRGEFEVAGEIFPVRHLSGDFFKVMELSSTALGLAVGDIAGKGLTAGIWQAHMMALIQRAARRHGNPAEAMAEVNRHLCHDEGEPPITALFFARIDLRTSELLYCNAGLPAPLLLRGNTKMERLEKGGPILGAVKDGSFDLGRVSMGAGDMLVTYSDGVTECRDPLDREFDMDRLTAAAIAVCTENANKALFSLLGTVLDFADSCSPTDDLTVLVVRRRADIKREESVSQSKSFPVSRRRPASLKRAKNSDRRGHGSK